MKKIISAITIAAMLLALTACGSAKSAAFTAVSGSESASETSTFGSFGEASAAETTEEQTTEGTGDGTDETGETAETDIVGVDEDGNPMGNPMTEYSSMEEINALTAMNLCQPGVMGVTDESYYVIDCGDYSIAEYDFSLNGTPLCFRGSADFADDISGIYNDDGTTAFQDADVEAVVITDTYMAARWATTDGQYVLSATGESLPNEDSFRELADELQAETAANSNNSDGSEPQEEGDEEEFNTASASLLAQLKDEAQSGWETMTPEDLGVSTTFNMVEAANIGYELADVNGDGLQELLLGEIVDGGENVIYDIYAENDAGRMVHLFSGGERDRCYFLADGTFEEEGSSGADDSFTAHYAVTRGEWTELEEEAGEHFNVSLKAVIDY